jgi:hypothetical protein
MKKFIIWVAKTNIFYFSVILCTLNYAIKITVHTLKYIFQIPDIQFYDKPINDNFNISFDLIVDSLILAPILETLIYQTFFYFIYKRLKLTKWVIVILSAVVFGMNHNYSLFYMLNASFIGCIFMCFYVLRDKYTNKPYLSTVIAHAAINFTVLIAVVITHYIKFGTLHSIMLSSVI